MKPATIYERGRYFYGPGLDCLWVMLDLGNGDYQSLGRCRSERDAKAVVDFLAAFAETVPGYDRPPAPPWPTKR